VIRVSTNKPIRNKTLLLSGSPVGLVVRRLKNGPLFIVPDGVVLHDPSMDGAETAGQREDKPCYLRAGPHSEHRHTMGTPGASGYIKFAAPVIRRHQRGSGGIHVQCLVECDYLFAKGWLKMLVVVRHCYCSLRCSKSCLLAISTSLSSPLLVYDSEVRWMI
jgi:hypothetical protein